MSAILAGLRVVEVSAFVAAPLGGMTLAQLGADVVQVSPIAGRIDTSRWPVTASGASLYWAGLNKGKRSIRLALDRPEGQEIAAALIAAPGEGGGIALTNLPARGWLSYAALRARREDVILLKLLGNADGSAAIDYTVNCASGFPTATGTGAAPVNHVLPAWDVAAGLYLVAGLLAAERHRRITGQGQEVTTALSDVMLATVGNLGFIAEVQVNGEQRPPLGNDLYGAFGRDFPTRDGRRVMVAAISDRQWRALCAATGLADRLVHIEALMGVNLGDEGGRYHARDAIAAVLAPWFAARSLAEIAQAFAGTGVLWGPYQDFRQLVAEDPRCSTANPLFREIDQPGVGRHLAPHAPLGFGAVPRGEVVPAPLLGQHTEEILADVLGLPAAEIGRLMDGGIAAGMEPGAQPGSRT